MSPPYTIRMPQRPLFSVWYCKLCNVCFPKDRERVTLEVAQESVIAGIALVSAL